MLAKHLRGIALPGIGLTVKADQAADQKDHETDIGVYAEEQRVDVGIGKHGKPPSFSHGAPAAGYGGIVKGGALHPVAVERFGLMFDHRLYLAGIDRLFAGNDQKRLRYGSITALPSKQRARDGGQD